MASFRVMVKGVWKGPFAEDALIAKYNAGGIPLGTRVQDVATNGEMAIEELAAGATLVLDQPARAISADKPKTAKLTASERNAPTQRIAKPAQKPLKPAPGSSKASGVQIKAPPVSSASGRTSSGTSTGATISGSGRTSSGTSTGATLPGASGRTSSGTSTGATLPGASTQSGATKSGESKGPASSRATTAGVKNPTVTVPDEEEDSPSQEAAKKLKLPSGKRGTAAFVPPSDKKKRGFNFVFILGCLAMLGSLGAPWMMFEGARADGGNLLLNGYDLPLLLTVRSTELGEQPAGDMVKVSYTAFAIYFAAAMALLGLLDEFIGKFKARNRWWLRILVAAALPGVIFGGAAALQNAWKNGTFGAEQVPAALLEAADYQAFLKAAFGLFRDHIQFGVYIAAASVPLLLIGIFTSPKRTPVS